MSEHSEELMKKLNNLKKIRNHPIYDDTTITIARDILEHGVDQASKMHNFRVNNTGERRPDIRVAKMRKVVNCLRDLGHEWQMNADRY